MESNKNIGIITLCGLIIGPILGSGIVLLPPLAFQMIGSWSILAWILIMILGVVFAYVFIFLSLESPGNEGVSIAVRNTLGEFWSELTSNFLSVAICFGPTAVLLTASSFLKNFGIFSNVNIGLISLGLEFICASILAVGIKTFSKLSLILTSSTAILLFCGSIYSLLFSSNAHVSNSHFSYSKFAYTLLLLFWAIIGWEIVGNYIEDIKNPQKTLKKAMNISLIVIVILYILVAISLTRVSNNDYSVISIMTPLFGYFASPIISIIALGLCICTYLMVVGGASRMNASRAKKGALPAFFAYLGKNESPIIILITYLLIHSFIYGLVFIHFLTIDKLVTCANVFFLSNALIGLITGFRLLKNIKLRIAIIILIASFSILLFRAALWSLILLILVFLLTLYKSYNNL
jgi:APA family basic amino acid/polyamine antiporter